jgi:L-rhamnose isomerase / sugar isomerase
MSTTYRIPEELVAGENAARLTILEEDYDHLGSVLQRNGREIEEVTTKVRGFGVALPSWGVGTGGTRFARFPGIGEPRHVFDKLEDCATIQQLVRATPTVSLHIPWDEPDDAAELRECAASLGLGFDAMNSNTFQDQPGQELSYRYGSLSHTDPGVREQAIEHNIKCVEIGRSIGSRALTVWVADGSNFPGQQDFRGALGRYLTSMREVYAALPDDWRVFIEHKLFEPAFYSTVINDWGTSYWCARELGDKALCLVDLGHHAPNTNIEMVVARLLQFGKLGGFHFNDSKYGDDDLDAGSIDPFQLFLVFHELVSAGLEDPSFAPAYMLDQSHNVTDPVESLIASAIEVQRALARALLVDREALASYQESNDAMMAMRTLREAFQTDVSPILGMARHRSGGAIEPLAAYRKSEYRKKKGEERPASGSSGSGIV